MQVPSSLIHDDEPVSGESEAGIAIASVVADELKQYLDTKRTRLVQSIAGGVIALGAGGYLLSAGQGSAAVIAFVLAIAAFGAGVYIYRRTPDVRIKRAEKRFWTTHLFPQSDGVLLVDGTRSIPDTTFELESIEKQNKLRQISEELREPWDLPIILPREENVELALQHELSQLESVFSNTKQTSIQVPTIEEESTLVNAVNSVTAHAQEGVHDIESIEISRKEAREEVEKIENLETLAFEDNVEETLSEVNEYSSKTIDRITETQQEMVELLNDSIQSVGDSLTMVSYNFYCSTCLEDEIYTTLEIQRDDGELEWYCETCRDSQGAEHPVPINRIKDDLVNEIWDRLWIEKDDEKRGIYEEIEDQQTELKEREFEQKQESIRDGWNRIKDIRSKIRDLETEAAAGKGAVEEIGDIMVKYDRLREDRKEEFQEDVARAIERVDEETKQVLEETRNFEQEKTEAAEKEAEQRAEIRRAEEQRRHREQLTAQDGGLGIGGTISSKIHKQKMKMKRKRIETTSGAEDWGDPDVRGGLAVDTDRPAVIDATAASLRAQVTGVTKAEQVTVYFEWRDITADDNWVLNRDDWNETTKVPLTSPGPFKAEVTDLDPDAKYEVRAVAEADDEQYTGETLIYPDDATTEAGVDVEAINEELPEISRSTSSRSGTDSSEPDSSSDLDSGTDSSESDSSSDQFCPECGSTIQENDDFCQNCGNEIKDLFKNRELPDAEVNNEERRHRAFGTGSESQPLEAQTNCPACGARISADQENCDYCGEVLVESTAEQRSDKP